MRRVRLSWRSVPEPLPLRIHSPFRHAHRVRVRCAAGGSSAFARRGWAPDEGGAGREVAPLKDAQQIVYNGAYLTYSEVARIEYFRAIGLLGHIEQTLAESCVQYLAPARWDDQLDLPCRCVRVGRTSFRLEYMIREATSDRPI